MRTLILAFIGFLFLTTATGCGVVTTVATNTCTGDYYNHIVCPGILEKVLEKALDAPPTTKTPTKTAPVEVEECTASGFVVRRGHVERVLTRSKGNCTNERLLLQEHLRKVGPGVECSWTKGQIKCAGFNPLSVLFILATLLTSRRKTREEWFGFEALLYRETRKMVWAIEDELYKSRWFERAIEIAITVLAFSMGGLILGLASTLLAHKRYGWGSIFALFLSVLLWGSALEWWLLGVKAVMCFLANTDEGFLFLKWVLHQRWKRQVAKL